MTIAVVYATFCLTFEHFMAICHAKSVCRHAFAFKCHDYFSLLFKRCLHAGERCTACALQSRFRKTSARENLSLYERNFRARSHVSFLTQLFLTEKRECCYSIGLYAHVAIYSCFDKGCPKKA